ncbi:hypothetical protein AHAS_Ahas13G0227300 [Arachis hypogaea]
MERTSKNGKSHEATGVLTVSGYSRRRKYVSEVGLWRPAKTEQLIRVLSSVTWRVTRKVVQCFLRSGPTYGARGRMLMKLRH